MIVFVGREVNAQVPLSNEHAGIAGCSPSDHHAMLEPAVGNFLSKVSFHRPDPNFNHKEGEERQENSSKLDGDERPFGENGADRKWGSKMI